MELSKVLRILSIVFACLSLISLLQHATDVGLISIFSELVAYYRATCKNIPKSAHQLPVQYQTKSSSDKNNTLPYIKAPNCYFHELRACFDRL
jgi:hypothetical protein